MANKFGLGAGAAALFAQNDDMDSTPQVQGQAEITLPLDKILANPNQPRKNFDEASLQELAASIRENGVIQPIIVEDTGGGNWTIIAGERRSRAARMAGLTEIPALIKKFSDDKRYLISIIENLQREDLNPIEEATAYRQLMDMANISQEEAAARVGKNRSTVANALRLLKLPETIQQALINGSLSAGHARAILSLNTDEEKQKLFSEITEHGISVREAEKKAAELSGGNTAADENTISGDGNKTEDVKQQSSIPEKSNAPAPRRDPQLDALQQKLIEILGTKVSIDGSLGKGVIRIEYYTMDDLDRINDLLISK